MLCDSEVQLGLPIGFPQGFNLAEVERLEVALVWSKDTHELGMMINTCALMEVADNFGALVKAIIEIDILTAEEKVVVTEIAEQAGAKFVKASSGTLPHGVGELSAPQASSTAKERPTCRQSHLTAVKSRIGESGSNYGY